MDLENEELEVEPYSPTVLPRFNRQMPRTHYAPSDLINRARFAAAGNLDQAGTDSDADHALRGIRDFVSRQEGEGTEHATGEHLPEAGIYNGRSSRATGATASTDLEHARVLQASGRGRGRGRGSGRGRGRGRRRRRGGSHGRGSRGRPSALGQERAGRQGKSMVLTIPHPMHICEQKLQSMQSLGMAATFSQQATFILRLPDQESRLVLLTLYMHKHNIFQSPVFCSGKQ